MRCLYIIGAPKSGKSTLGQGLSAKFGWAVTETDEIVEELCGMSIEQLLIERGEAEYRRLERDALARAEKARGIIVLGGGALDTQYGYDLVKRDLCEGSARVLITFASISVLAKRIGLNAPRLGVGLPIIASMKEMCNRRHDRWRTLPEAVWIDTSQITQKQTVERAVSALAPYLE